MTANDRLTMQVFDNVMETLFPPNLNHDLLHGVCRGQKPFVRILIKQRMGFLRTEDDTNQSENYELTDNQEGEIPSDDGSV